MSSIQALTFEILPSAPPLMPDPLRVGLTCMGSFVYRMSETERGSGFRV
ncbi:hypothetical protein SLEP1_g53226 [Rubroshorea leprosula]|uniref:Uncharacterized protein n=1 Tax=Rubroshorea leprosula TaxID=152421 RepID=A0AAV5MCP6_9ROSI|nr:hypothetical protein SLEP1_g53226 [Rubroshorea leprosula]